MEGLTQVNNILDQSASGTMTQQDNISEPMQSFSQATSITQTKEYVYAIGDLIGGVHVKAAVRIPGNLIPIYVSMPEQVD